MVFMADISNLGQSIFLAGIYLLIISLIILVISHPHTISGFLAIMFEISIVYIFTGLSFMLVELIEGN